MGERPVGSAAPGLVFEAGSGSLVMGPGRHRGEGVWSAGPGGGVCFGEPAGGPCVCLAAVARWGDGGV